MKDKTYMQYISFSNKIQTVLLNLIVLKNRNTLTIEFYPFMNYN